MNKPIQALSSSTRNTIRSTQILTSLPQIVSELLQNALDADARHVDVGFDKDDWSCWVRDDGHGISKDGMLTLAQGNSEEGRYATSKAYDPDSLNVLSTFGFRGEALASAANLCCLEIASRTAMSRETWSIILKGGKTLYTGAAVRWRRESPGTTVVVRDAFYNLPVRRNSHPSYQRTFELVRREIETYALVFPQVSFSLGHSKEQTPSDATLKIPKTPSALLTFQHLFGKALVQHVDTIDVCSGDLRMEGFISLDGAQSKNHQFLYINKHPIALGELHKLIDSKFSGSSFAKHAYDEAGESNLRPMVRRSPRKTEKRPVYVLNMTVPPRQIDNCLEPAKLHLQFQNKNAVVSLLSSAIQSFLVRHGFLIHTSATKARYDTSPPPRKRRRYEAEDDSGYAEALDEGAGDDDDLDFESLSKPLFIRSEKCLGSSGDVLWTDRNTGELFVVDSRTGNSRPQGKIRPGDEEDQAESTEAKRLTFSRGHPTANKEIPKWIQDALAANEVYAPTETKIPSVNSTETIPKGDVSGQLQNAQSHGCHRLPRLPSSAQVDVASSSTAHRYRKEDLLNANVINQVDKKFIACLINDTGRIDAREMGNGRALVLIDQHAADERVRVEQFLRPLCLGFLHGLRGVEDKEKLVKTKDLSPTRPILLTSYEASRLAGDLEIRKTFHNWGFEFGTLDGVSLSHGDTESGYVQVMVERIPEVVSDKLLAGDELRDLVKAVLANPPKSAAIHVEDDAMIPGSTGNGTVWLKALRWCPRELLELVNSKACRGAIMFNDTLTIAQCEKLVRQLAETVFPFQCAHGRPSLVPLTDISSMRSRPNGGEVCWSRLDDRELY